jgi:hypothetical protein
MIKYFFFFCVLLMAQIYKPPKLCAQRQDKLVLENWETIANDSLQKNWKQVNLPHNWDVYDGYQRRLHGNLHGYALYKKRVQVTKQNGIRYFLYFEGVGSYATVYVNNKKVGYHAGGRTGFSIDITDALNPLPVIHNDIKVLSEHPANCKDLPWVCGGCSDERGFSEGSQPMGIFRPVHLITTKNIRIEHEGVHIWNDTTVTSKAATLSLATSIKNYSAVVKNIEVSTTLLDAAGEVVSIVKQQKQILAGATVQVPQQIILDGQVHLWSPQSPYLYKVVTQILDAGKKIDEIITPYGIRSVTWDLTGSHRLYINHQPVFLNGIGEYEHMFGSSHAFTNKQIKARVSQIAAAGFNAFRDAHHPHNLLYQKLLESSGLLWWTQMSAHVWYDNEAFRSNFKNLLKEWVLERRNSPALILWGLQNESKLPQDFAKECSDIIRSLDPTASTQRLITTCNGGEGTDWDVPQNWTGTYGGDPNTYASDLKKQILVGEYGAWRTTDLHTEGNFKQNGPYSEERFSSLLETKIALAESVRDSAIGHFQWIFASHDNPGRVQAGEGFRALDQVGPVNYKGLFNTWDEPTAAYYMYRSNYANASKDPMVYIPMHNWSNRWLTPGVKDELIVYSNCDEVVLYNDNEKIEIGRQRHLGIGKHFTFKNIEVKYNVLVAVGYVNGKAVAKDVVRLYNFPTAPNLNQLLKPVNITKPKPGYHYLYRVNCGGDNYTDVNGKNWFADNSHSQNSFYSSSWTKAFGIEPNSFASQRSVADFIKSTQDQKLFQSIRYGKEQLRYHFKVPNGVFRIELYFVEPWFGAAQIDATGWRNFDVRCNNKVVFKNLDIYNEVGYLTALQKSFDVTVTDNQIIIDFPNVIASQAIIAALAVATKEPITTFKTQSYTGVNFVATAGNLKSWLNTADTVFLGSNLTYFQLPSFAYGANYMQWTNRANSITKDSAALTFLENTELYIADTAANQSSFLKSFEKTKEALITSDGKAWSIYKKQYKTNERIWLAPSSASIVFWNPSPTLQPAFDLKPVISIRPPQVKISGLATKDSINTKEAVAYGAGLANSSWPFIIGAADIYSCTIRYANTTQKNIEGNVQWFAADGTMFKSEKLNFTPSKTGKWNYLSIDTGNMINAGRYQVTIELTDAKGVYISGVEIQ